MTEAVKRNISSMQVIKTLQILLEDNYTMAELIKKLNSNEKEPLFNNSVVSKYINTCRYCGIDIPKIHNKYFVASLPFGLDLTSKEVDLIDKLEEIAKANFSKKQFKVFEKLLEKVSKYSNKRIMRVEKDSVNLTHKMFNDAIDEQRKIRLMFRTKEVVECIPLDMVQHKGRTFFNVLYDNNEKLISEDRVSGIEITTTKFSVSKSAINVVYVLKGELAKRYEARENEVITENPDKSIKVVNVGENKNILLSRLLRYDKSCEILTPKSYRDEMKRILTDTLRNYGE